MAEAHTHPNYMVVFWWLLALTIAELIVIYMPIARAIIVTLLVGLALSKAALVGLFFMHLKFERFTLGLIALTPFFLCIFWILVISPDLHP